MPGPGSYDVKANGSVRAGAFSTSKRDTIKQIAKNSNESEMMPGPGNYNVDRRIEGGFKMG